MAKEVLKRRIAEEQGRNCAICGEPVSEETALVDTDRRNPKANGGEYTDPNTRVVHPECHMRRHGIHRVREDDFHRLKMIIDDREQVRKLAIKVNNQMLAHDRQTDELSEVTQNWLVEQAAVYKAALADRDKLLGAWVREHKTDPFVKAMLGVKGIGPVTIAYCLVYIDLTGVFAATYVDRAGKEKPHPRAGQEKAPHASSLWAYVGLDKPSHSRYTKGISGGGNKTLRTVLYTMAEAQMKGRGAYREVYDRVKARLSVSEKITKSKNTQGHLIECAWKDTKPSHRHGAALRAVMKCFLADYWFVGRELLGLPTNPLYAEAILGHDGHRTVSPRERGWNW